MTFQVGDQVRLRQVFTVASIENNLVKVEAGGFYETYHCEQLVLAEHALINGDIVRRRGNATRITLYNQKIDAFATESERKEFLLNERKKLVETHDAAIAAIDSDIAEFERQRKQLQEKSSQELVAIERDLRALQLPVLPQLPQLPK